MIIVDDASTDETGAIIDKIATIYNRIKVVRLYKNLGTGISRKSAFDFAKGK